MSQRVSFVISYDGEALRSHSMDVRDLGPALMSLGQLFDEANHLINGDKVSIRIHVKAHQEGSFEIAFEAIQSFRSQLSGFLSSDFVTSAKDLTELILGTRFVGKGLFWLIRKLKGQKPNKITSLQNNWVRIEFEGDTFDVPLNLLRFYQDISIRTATEKVLKPLDTQGIDAFIIKQDQDQIDKVDKKEKIYFIVPEIEDEKLVQTEHEMSYSIVSLAFKEDNKWRLYDGNSTISVAIKDKDFSYKVDNNLVSFAKGDILICKVRTSQWTTSSGLKIEHEVLEVKEHRPAARQMSLFRSDEIDPLF